MRNKIQRSSLCVCIVIATLMTINIRLYENVDLFTRVHEKTLLQTHSVIFERWERYV